MKTQTALNVPKKLLPVKYHRSPVAERFHPTKGQRSKYLVSYAFQGGVCAMKFGEYSVGS